MAIKAGAMVSDSGRSMMPVLLKSSLIQPTWASSVFEMTVSGLRSNRSWSTASPAPAWGREQTMTIMRIAMAGIRVICTGLYSGKPYCEWGVMAAIYATPKASFLQMAAMALIMDWRQSPPSSYPKPKFMSLNTTSVPPVHAHAIWQTALSADALSMPVHWVYDTDAIRSEFPVLDTFQDAPDGSYHAGRKAGELTHYGDQLAWLVGLMNEDGWTRPCFEEYVDLWTAKMRDEGYNGYRDKATSKTLENIDEGMEVPNTGSGSLDLGGIARTPAILTWGLLNAVEEAVLRRETRRFAVFSHGVRVAEVGEFFAVFARHLVLGKNEESAWEAALAAAHWVEPFEFWNDKARESQQRRVPEAVKALGAGCGIEGAVPASLHLWMKFQDDPRRMLIENAMAGGDSAARGILLGMLCAAAYGSEWIPSDWRGAGGLTPPVDFDI